MDDCIAGRPSKMVHLGGSLDIATRTQQHAFFGVEFVSYADIEFTRQHGDILVLRMIMSRYFVAHRHFQSNNVKALFGRVARNDSELRARRNVGWHWTPLHVVCIDRRRMSWAKAIAVPARSRPKANSSFCDCITLRERVTQPTPL